jgi:AcrR family transcriptional regulator
VAVAARTRDEVLRQSARLFAERGFRGTSVGDIGAACGVSGPALYKHFPSKQAILGRLLVDISEQLLDGARDVLGAAADPVPAVRGLVEFHADFALAEPDLIRVQGRDLDSLRESEQAQVRRLQRDYVALWCDALRALDPRLPGEAARVRAHAVLGLLNSTPHSTHRAPSEPERARARDELTGMALRALGVEAARAAQAAR